MSLLGPTVVQTEPVLNALKPENLLSCRTSGRGPAVLDSHKVGPRGKPNGQRAHASEDSQLSCVCFDNISIPAQPTSRCGQSFVLRNDAFVVPCFVNASIPTEERNRLQRTQNGNTCSARPRWFCLGFRGGAFACVCACALACSGSVQSCLPRSSRADADVSASSTQVHWRCW